MVSLVSSDDKVAGSAVHARQRQPAVGARYWTVEVKQDELERLVDGALVADEAKPVATIATFMISRHKTEGE